MKQIIFVGFVLLCVASFTKSEADLETLKKDVKILRSELEEMEKIKEFLGNATNLAEKWSKYLDDQQKSLEARCPGAQQRNKDLDKPYNQCVNNTLGDPSSLTFCTATQRYLLNCSPMIVEVVGDCLPERSRGLLRLGFKSMNSAVDYLCKADGVTFFELFRLCLWDNLGEHNEGAVKKCTEKVSTTAHKFRNQPPNTSEVCTEATGFRSCIETRVQHTCKNSIKARSAFLGFYDSLTAPCTDDKN